MRIALVTPVFYPYIAGMSRVVEHEARMLARAGHTVTVITARFSAPRGSAIITARCHASYETVEKKDGYVIHWLRPIFSYGNAAALPQLARVPCDGYDVIHLHYPFIGGAVWTVLGVLWARARGHQVKLVVTYHMDLVGRGAMKYIFELFTRAALPCVVGAADYIRVSSMDYARHSRYAKYLARYPRKLVEIPFGIDTEKFSPRARSVELLQEYGVPADNKILLFVGALDRAHYFKGVPVLLKTLAEQCADSRITLIIAGEGNVRTEFEHLARTLRIEDRVRFVGFVPAEKLPALYSTAHMLVLPSTDSSEAFGMVLVEAQACGTPVVASDLPGVRSVIDVGKTGMLARPGNAADLARVITHILNAPDYDDWRTRARERAERLYGYDKELSILQKLFENR